MVQVIMLATERSVSVAARVVALSLQYHCQLYVVHHVLGGFTGYLDIASGLCCYAMGCERF